MGPIIEIKNLYKSFDNINVLKDINLKINKGEILSIIGTSGSGKSTLIRCINGLESVQSGEILIDGIPFNSKKDNINIRKKIGMVFQNFNLFPHYTVIENIAIPNIIVNKISKEEAFFKAKNLLRKVKLEDKENCYPFSLSGGQKQRVAIARALSMNPEIILFDEPTSALDPELSYEVLETIKSLASEGLTMIIVSHQINFIKKISNKIIFIDNGQILEEGIPVEVLNNPKTEKLKNFLIYVDMNS